ncbi:MAG: type II toxin-antitoxin system RelE/ParE family toxin [Bacteroidales bacterium]|nr:type II toxin-antitoxin system RelE/ParE family toxin [Bacteroidales bacterium]
MKVEFVSFDVFNKIWDDLGLTDDDLKDLQEYLIINSENGSVIQGTGGVRKIRWALKNKGKSGGIRVLYIDFVAYEKIYLLMVYPKNQKDNISDREKKIIKQLVTELKYELRRKNHEKKL